MDLSSSNTQQTINVPIWAGVGLLNFTLGVAIFIQFYIAYITRDERDVVFPMARRFPGFTYVYMLVFGLMYFSGITLSRGSKYTFTLASAAVMLLFIALLPASGWIHKNTTINTNAMIGRVALFLAAIASTTALVTAPSSATRLFLTPYTVVLLSASILTEAQNDILVDHDIDQASKEGSD